MKSLWREETHDLEASTIKCTAHLLVLLFDLHHGLPEPHFSKGTWLAHAKRKTRWPHAQYFFFPFQVMGASLVLKTNGQVPRTKLPGRPICWHCLGSWRCFHIRDLDYPSDEWKDGTKLIRNVVQTRALDKVEPGRLNDNQDLTLEKKSPSGNP